jgi:hypothetical protein
MTSDCPERRRLAKKIAESTAAVSDIKKLQESGKTKDASLPVLLDQARTAQRNSEKALSEHIKECGCVTP